MHGGQTRVLHNIPNTLRRSVNDGAHRHVVRMFPGAAIKIRHVLPDEPSQDAIVAIIKQELSEG